MNKSKKKKLEKNGWKVSKNPDDFLYNGSQSVEVEIVLADEDILKLCLEAHKRDITLNHFCNLILKEYIKDSNEKID